MTAGSYCKLPRWKRCYWADVILFPLRKQVFFFLSRLMLWNNVLVLRFYPLWCWYLITESCICRKWSTAGLCPSSSKLVEIKQTALKANLQAYNLKCRSAILYKSLVRIKIYFLNFYWQIYFVFSWCLGIHLHFFRICFFISWYWIISMLIFQWLI